MHLTLPEGLRNAIFEDAAPAVAAAPKPRFNQPDTPPDPLSQAATTTPAAVPAGISADPTEASGSTDMLAMLTSRTDFATTRIGKLLDQHLAPLEGLPLTDAQKISAALKAGARDGLTTAAILDAVHALPAQLKAEQKRFDDTLALATEREVATRQKALDNAVATITALEAQVAAARLAYNDLSMQLVTANARIDRSAAQFRTAYETRTAAIADTIQHFDTILKGL